MRAVLLRSAVLLALFTQTNAAWAEGNNEVATPKPNGAASAKSALQELQSGKLIQYGVTGGIGLALMLPSALNIENRRPQMASVTGMPYIAFLPAFWSSNQVRNAYCANSLTSKADPAKAEQAANERAEVIAPLEGATVADVSTRIFNPKANVPCGWYKVGFFFGVPLGYRAQVVRDEAAEANPKPAGFPSEVMPSYASTQINPGIAHGIIYAPNAYVSLLFGASYVTFNDEGAPGRLYHSVVPTFTLGGNLDLLGILLPTKN